MSEAINITLPVDTLEGTTAKVLHWLVSEGEEVSKGMPLLELETDKVTMEICAEESGIVETITAQPGADVAEGDVLGTLAMDLAEDRIAEVHQLVQNVEPSSRQASALPGSEYHSLHAQAVAYPGQGADHNPHPSGYFQGNARHLVGPAVRRLLKEHQLDINLIEGSGRGGRVTRDDVLAFIAEGRAHQNDDLAAATVSVASTQTQAKVIEPGADMNTVASIGASRLVPHSTMRKAIAHHMVDSLLNISPHVTSVFEMDMTQVIKHRNQCKLGFMEAGIKLTFTAYFLIAAAKAITKVPQVNARFHDDALEIFEDINIGIGTALGDEGLVVPVIRQVQQKNLFQVASALQQQTDKARAGKLTPTDLKGGTFTISNHGVSGSLFAAPIIINQPQVAILGIGKLEKRAVVEEIDGEDVINIRPKCYVSLSIDHRALDAYQTNLFLSHFVEVIERWGNDDTFSNRQVDPSRL